MRTYPVVFKELQMDQGIEGDITFGKGMRLASESIEPITESTVDPLNMDGSRLSDHLPRPRRRGSRWRAVSHAHRDA